MQAATGSPSTPVTAGQLGGGFIKTIEDWLGNTAGVGAPITQAEQNVEAQIQAARNKAAQGVAGPSATLSAETNAPGNTLLNNVRDYVAGKRASAKTQMDAIENQLGTLNTREARAAVRRWSTRAGLSMSLTVSRR